MMGNFLFWCGKYELKEIILFSQLTLKATITIFERLEKVE